MSIEPAGGARSMGRGSRLAPWAAVARASLGVARPISQPVSRSASWAAAATLAAALSGCVSAFEAPTSVAPKPGAEIDFTGARVSDVEIAEIDTPLLAAAEAADKAEAGPRPGGAASSAATAAQGGVLESELKPIKPVATPVYDPPPSERQVAAAAAPAEETAAAEAEAEAEAARLAQERAAQERAAQEQAAQEQAAQEQAAAEARAAQERAAQRKAALERAARDQAEREQAALARAEAARASAQPAAAPAAAPERDGVLALAAAAERKAAPPAAASRRPGARFRDCPDCPEMVALPAGRFQMGSPQGEPDRAGDEGPQRAVAVPAFAVGRFEVTNAQWGACAKAGYCRAITPKGGPDAPAVSVSWRDVAGSRGFLAWLNSQAQGAPYRLPSEAEWEYAARAGTVAPFWTGDQISPLAAHFGGAGGGAAEVGQLTPNPFGLYDMQGNVWEWTSDCYMPDYAGAPENGAPRRDGDCGLAPARGGAWSSAPADLRAAKRWPLPRDAQADALGFRVARSLP